MKVKISDKDQFVALIEEILSKGNQVEVKKERENVVIVEIKRNAVIKSPIPTDE